MKAKFKEGDRVELKQKYRRKRHAESKCVGTVVNVSNYHNFNGQRKCYEVKFDDLSHLEVFYSYELDLLEIVASRMLTPDRTLLWSRFTHDCVFYHDTVSDEDYMLDGGREYQHTIANKVKAIDLSVFSNAPWEVQREVELRGTFDKSGNRVWVPVSKLSNAHINNLVIDTGLRKNTPYYRELCYRQENHIEIPDHDYKDENVKSITFNYKQS